MAQRIIIAAGVEIRDTRQQYDLLQTLNTRARPAGTNKWTFPPGPPANARFEVEVVFTQQGFRKALEEDGAWVVYSGHSRYGQGPAFGPAKTPHCPTKASMPTNPWGEHFRMGYDATDTECIEDLLEHGVEPTEYDLTTTPSGAFLPTALVGASRRAKEVERDRKRGRLSRAQKRKPCTIRGAWRSLDVCKPTEAALFSLRPSQPLRGRHYYAQITSHGHPEFLTSVVAGHADLDTTALKCAALFMGSCSSNVHYRAALVAHRKAQGAKCWFYLTSHINTASHASTFVGTVFNGTNPATKAGSKAMVKALNAQDDPGTVVAVKP